MEYHENWQTITKKGKKMQSSCLDIQKTRNTSTEFGWTPELYYVMPVGQNIIYKLKWTRVAHLTYLQSDVRGQ